MSDGLRAKQWVPLSGDEREALRAEAAKRDMTVGLLSRALLIESLEHLDSAGTARRIEEEKLATRRRISEGARAAARTRWDCDGGSEK